MPKTAADHSPDKHVAEWQAHNRQRSVLFARDCLPVERRIAFVCECSSGACFETVMLTALEYEASHMSPEWRAIRPQHVVEDDEQIVLHGCDFWVVERRSHIGRLPPIPSCVRWRRRYADAASNEPLGK